MILKDYQLLTAPSAGALAEQVRDYITKGYVLHGDTQRHEGTSYINWFQAMVKYEA